MGCIQQDEINGYVPRYILIMDTIELCDCHPKQKTCALNIFGDLDSSSKRTRISHSPPTNEHFMRAHLHQWNFPFPSNL